MVTDIELCVLSSGSRANATLICSGATSLLIDCGLSSKMLNSRLRDIGKVPEQITDILVTHEHSDHIYGVCTVAKKTGARVWVTKKTSKAWKEFQCSPPFHKSFFESGTQFLIGDLVIHPFSTSHDAIDPVGVRISAAETVIGYCTDLGHVTTEVRERLRGLNALVLESNHEPALLSIAPYPASLKSRIASRRGHLSNHVASALLEELLQEENCKLELVVAAHISEKANDPFIVRDSLQTAIGKHSTIASKRIYLELIVANALEATAPWKSTTPQQYGVSKSKEIFGVGENSLQLEMIVENSTEFFPAKVTGKSDSVSSALERLLELL